MEIQKLHWLSSIKGIGQLPDRATLIALISLVEERKKRCTTPSMQNRVSSVRQGSGLPFRSCPVGQGEAAKTLFFIAEKRCVQA